MRYASRAAVLVVAFVMVFGVAACGTNQGTGGGAAGVGITRFGAAVSRPPRAAGAARPATSAAS